MGFRMYLLFSVFFLPVSISNLKYFRQFSKFSFFYALCTYWALLILSVFFFRHQPNNKWIIFPRTYVLTINVHLKFSQPFSFRHVNFHLSTVDADLKFPQTVVPTLHVNLVITDEFAIEESILRKTKEDLQPMELICRQPFGWRYGKKFNLLKVVC